MRTRVSVTHHLFDGKLHVYKRENSRFWQCAAFIAGKNHRISTKQVGLAQAKDVAEDWYLGLKGKLRNGELKEGKTFKSAAELFQSEYEALMVGERSPEYIASHALRLRVHLLPFFGNKVLPEITPGLVQQYRVHRATSRKDSKTGEPMRPARTTVHHDIVTLRLVLKAAQRQGWLDVVPDLSNPYKASAKISHRAWFSPEEYKRLYEATRRRAKDPPKIRWRWACEQLHDFVLFMVNTGLRPDEAWRLQFRDVEIVEDVATGETILEISVRGKRGVGYCKSMPGAVMPFERLRDRRRPEEGGRRQRRMPEDDGATESSRLTEPADLIFPDRHRELLNNILDEEDLKRDREGRLRTAYSLRHTYICLRLMEGADIYQIAKNCRTSVEMIEKHYAAHIKNMIDAAAVNIRRSKPNGAPPKRKANAKVPKRGSSGGHPKRRA